MAFSERGLALWTLSLNVLMCPESAFPFQDLAVGGSHTCEESTVQNDIFVAFRFQ